jgi:nitroreductase
MGTIQFTDRDTAVRVRPEARTLAQAAVAALAAPSIFNSQPWRWRVSSDVAELRADRARQLHSLDPDGRMLTVSCGLALHHALTALRARGTDAVVERLPDPDDPDLLARVRATGHGHPDPAAVRLSAAMAVRRTDRRPFADVVVSSEQLDAVRAAAESAGAHLYLVPREETVVITTATAQAAATEASDSSYRSDLETWTHRDEASHDGLDPQREPATNAPRPVVLRDFSGAGPTVDDHSNLVDRFARYGVLFTNADDRRSWLTAGEALSAVLLTAVDLGLAASPMSDVVEVPATRWRLRRALSGTGHPIVALRLGVAADRQPAPPTPRRPATEIIELVTAKATQRPAQS